MSNKFLHEEIYRSTPLMALIREQPITVCGAGAIGANLIDTLARSGFARIAVIDRDRVEEQNLSTQPYERADIGALKAKMIQNRIYRAVGVEIEAEPLELKARNAEKLLAQGLIVDAFDNSTSRALVTERAKKAGLDCLHVGLAGDYAEVVWNEGYRVPSSANDDVCDYPLARNLIMLAVAVAAETIVDWVATRQKRSHTITLRDFAIASFTPTAST